MRVACSTCVSTITLSSTALVCTMRPYGGRKNGYTWGGAGLTSQASDYPFTMPLAIHAAINAARLSSTRKTLKTTSFASHALLSDLVLVYLGCVITHCPLLSPLRYFDFLYETPGSQCTDRREDRELKVFVHTWRSGGDRLLGGIPALKVVLGLKLPWFIFLQARHILGSFDAGGDLEALAV